MKLKPLFDRILVKRTGETVSKGGIILVASDQKESSLMGTVHAVGEAKQLKPGDTVIYPRWAGNEVHVETEKFFLMKEEDVEAVVVEA